MRFIELVRAVLGGLGPGRRAAARSVPAACAALVLAACAGAPGNPQAERTAAPGGSGARVTQEPGRDAPADAVEAHGAVLEAMRAGDEAAAAAELERLIAAHPELPGPHVNAAILYRRAGRLDDAHAALERALAIDPGHPEANNELGIVLRERGEFEAAEAAYRRALERRPDYALALHNLGVLLDVYMRRPADALECYEAYQSLLPEPDEQVARWIIDLRRRVGADDGSARLASGGPQ